MKIFQRCPPPESLLEFLDQSLPEKEIASLAKHIETCKKCQTKLDELTSDDPLESTRESVRKPKGNSSLYSLISRLQTEKSPFETDHDTAHTTKTTSTSPPVSLPSPPASGDGIELDHYRLLEIVGSGGSGVVYKALDTKLDRTVAIKLLRGELVAGDDSAQRLQREAKSIAGLSHPNVMAVFELGQSQSAHEHPLLDHSKPYLVTEFVDGQSLENRLTIDGSLPQRWVAKLIRDTATGLEAAHQANLVHRDIKPSNILIVDKNDQPKIADFGLAIDEQLRSRLTHEGMIAGTPAYMSPEQIRNEDQLDRRSDVYSLGVVLYECLTGDVPFRGVARATIDRVLYEQPRDPKLLNPELPQDLCSICLKAISKSPERRYSSAKEFADDLTRWLDGEPVVARPISNWERLGWWIRNNQLAASLAGAAALLTLTILVGTIVYSFQLQAANLATTEALNQEKRLAVVAEKQRDVLLNTVQKLVYEVNDSLEAQVEDNDEIQRRLLRIALGGLESVANYSDQNSFVRKSADIHLRMGKVLFRLDDLQQAGRHFDLAERMAEDLASSEPDDQSLQTLVIRSQWWKGNNAFFLDRFTVAEDYWKRALASSKNIDITTCQDTDLLDDIAWGKINFADHQIDFDELDSAIELLSSALETLERLKSLGDSIPIEDQTIDSVYAANVMMPTAYSMMADAYYMGGDDQQTAEYDYLTARFLATQEPENLADFSPEFAQFVSDDTGSFVIEMTTLEFWRKRLEYIERSSRDKDDNLAEKATCYRMLTQLHSEMEEYQLAQEYSQKAVNLLETLASAPSSSLDTKQLAIIARVRHLQLLRANDDLETISQHQEWIETAIHDLEDEYSEDEEFDVIRWGNRVEYELNTIEFPESSTSRVD